MTFQINYRYINNHNIITIYYFIKITFYNYPVKY